MLVSLSAYLSTDSPVEGCVATWFPSGSLICSVSVQTTHGLEALKCS